MLLSGPGVATMTFSGVMTSARCKINRGTFYYHFRDIQDLINWIYHTEVILPARNMIEQMDLHEEFSITSFIMAETYRSR